MPPTPPSQVVMLDGRRALNLAQGAPVSAGTLRKKFFEDRVPEGERVRFDPGRSLTLDGIASAILNAEHGSMRDLTDLGRKTIDLDPKLASNVQKRIAQVAARPIRVQPASGDGIDREKAKKIADAVEKELRLLPSPWPQSGRRMGGVRSLVEDLAWGLWDGRAASELVWGPVTPTDARPVEWTVTEVQWIHPRRLGFGPRRELRFIPNDSPFGYYAPYGFYETGIDLGQHKGKFIALLPRLFGEYPEREGLAPRAIYWSFFKRFSMRERLILIELFGKPWKIVEVDKEARIDKPELERLDAEIEALGSQQSLRLPRGATLNVPNPGAGGGELHRMTIEQVDEQLAALILGNTMTTEGGGSRSIGEVGERQQDLILEQDAFRLTAPLQADLVDVLVRVNAKPLKLKNDDEIDAYTPTVIVDARSEPDRNAEAERIDKALKFGLSLSAAEVYDLVGFKRPTDDEDTLEQAQVYGVAGFRIVSPEEREELRELRDSPVDPYAKPPPPGGGPPGAPPPPGGAPPPPGGAPPPEGEEPPPEEAEGTPRAEASNAEDRAERAVTASAEHGATLLFDPNQPRAPQGSAAGGRWTKAGADMSADEREAVYQAMRRERAVDKVEKAFASITFSDATKEAIAASAAWRLKAESREQTLDKLREAAKARSNRLLDPGAAAVLLETPEGTVELARALANSAQTYDSGAVGQPLTPERIEQRLGLQWGQTPRTALDRALRTEIVPALTKAWEGLTPEQRAAFAPDSLAATLTGSLRDSTFGGDIYAPFEGMPYEQTLGEARDRLRGDATEAVWKRIEARPWLAGLSRETILSTVTPEARTAFEAALKYAQENVDAREAIGPAGGAVVVPDFLLDGAKAYGLAKAHEKLFERGIEIGEHGEVNIGLLRQYMNQFAPAPGQDRSDVALARIRQDLLGPGSDFTAALASATSSERKAAIDGANETIQQIAIAGDEAEALGSKWSSMPEWAQGTGLPFRPLPFKGSTREGKGAVGIGHAQALRLIEAGAPDYTAALEAFTGSWASNDILRDHDAGVDLDDATLATKLRGREKHQGPVLTAEGLAKTHDDFSAAVRAAAKSGDDQKHRSTLYRGLNSVPKHVLEKFLTNDEITIGKLSSSSTKQGIAVNFGRGGFDPRQQGTSHDAVFLEIRNAWGMVAAHRSRHEFENEVILLRGAKLKVTKRFVTRMEGSISSGTVPALYIVAEMVHTGASTRYGRKGARKRKPKATSEGAA